MSEDGSAMCDVVCDATSCLYPNVKPTKVNQLAKQRLQLRIIVGAQITIQILNPDFGRG